MVQLLQHLMYVYLHLYLTASFTIPAYSPTLGYIFGVGAAFIAGTILAFIFGTEGKRKEVKTEEAPKEDTTVTGRKGKN